MVPRNSARISEYVMSMSEVPGTGRSQLALSTGAPTTTGTAEFWKKCSWEPAFTSWLPGAQNTEPCDGAPSSVPSADSHVGDVTCTRTSVRTSIVVALGKVGGSSLVRPVTCMPCTPPWPTNRAHITNVGAAMANSLTQYWNAC